MKIIDLTKQYRFRSDQSFRGYTCIFNGSYISLATIEIKTPRYLRSPVTVSNIWRTIIDFKGKVKGKI